MVRQPTKRDQTVEKIIIYEHIFQCKVNEHEAIVKITHHSSFEMITTHHQKINSSLRSDNGENTQPWSNSEKKNSHDLSIQQNQSWPHNTENNKPHKFEKKNDQATQNFISNQQTHDRINHYETTKIRFSHGQTVKSKIDRDQKKSSGQSSKIIK